MRKIEKMLIGAAVFVFSTYGIFAGEPDKKTLKREAIRAEYKWDLSDIYRTQDAWQEDYLKVKTEYIKEIKEYRGKLKDIRKLYDCLKTADKLSKTVAKIYTHAALKSDENKADSKATENLSKAETLSSEAMEAAAFIEPEILEFGDGNFRAAKKDEDMKGYKHYLDKLKAKRKHTLSRMEEELLAKTTDITGCAREIYNKITLADMKYPNIKDETGKETALTNANYQLFIRSQNRDVRKAAFEGMYTTYESMKNSLAATLSGEVKSNIFYAKARNYKNAMESSLDAESIPPKVYESLVKSVDSKIESLHKYVKLRKKVLNIDKVHLYDMYVDLIDDDDKKISYEDSKKLIINALSPMGEEYTSNIKKAFKENWIDVYESENKYSGAYNWGTYDVHPYIIMNYNDNIDGVMTTIHELGHAMNSVYTNKKQSYINSNTPAFTAEVASTTNELILLDYLIKNAKTDKEKLYYVNKLAENIRGTVFSQVMYAEFEKAIHERVEAGEALSPDSLRKIWQELMQRYYGDDFAVDDLSTMWWSRVPHFYMNFYVYKYSTGMAAAYSLSLGIINNDSAALKRYLDFLSSGDSDYPIETLKKAGVDMTSEKPLSDLLVLFDGLVDQMEELLKKEGKIKD